MTRRTKSTLPFLALSVLLFGCSGGSGGSIGTADDPWQVTSDRENGGWEVVMLTSDQTEQEAFEKKNGFDYPGEGDPVLWVRKVDELEPYEPEIWGVDDEGNRIPFNYWRSSADGSTYLGASLVTAPSKSRTLTKLQIDVKGETVAEWSIRSPKFEAPATWPEADGEGTDITMMGVDLSVKPRRSHQLGGEITASNFGHSDDVEATSGLDEDYEYELRYVMLDEPEAGYASHYFNRAEQPQRGFGGGGGQGGGQAEYDEIGTYDVDVLCRLMKYRREPFEFNWDSGVAQYQTLKELEEAPVPISAVDDSPFIVFGVYWDTDYYINDNERVWFRVKGTGTSRREFSHELKQRWSSVFFEDCSIGGDKELGQLLDTYVLDDGSTVLVFVGSFMLEHWRDGEFSVTGHQRIIADYVEKVTRMSLPVTRQVQDNDEE